MTRLTLQPGQPDAVQLILREADGFIDLVAIDAPSSTRPAEKFCAMAGLPAHLGLPLDSLGSIRFSDTGRGNPQRGK